MTESQYESIVLAAAAFERASDERNDFCRICWGPKPSCPGHVGYMEMFGAPPTEAEIDAYRADLEVRARGLERKSQALNAAAIELGYGGINELMDKIEPHTTRETP